MTRFASGIHDALDAVHLVADTAYHYCNDTQGQQAALTWGDGFIFPQTVFERDATTLALHGGSLSALVSSVHRAAACNRFSVARVRDLIPPSDPHFDYLLALAEGLRIHLPEPYTPLSIPPPPRALYLSLQSPINKMVYALWETGKALIIPSHLLSDIPRIHYNPVHWTVSKGKPEGRLLIDPSDSAQNTPLNCESVRLWTDEHIGRIVHPTLSDYAHMILRYIDTLLVANPLWTLQGLIPRLRLFKMDLKGAFTLLNYHPADAGLMSSALTDGLTLISIVAGFGHTQTPAQFNHITRVMERLTQPLLHGLMLMYVDDVNGITLDTHLDHDLGVIRDTATRLLGPSAINDKKTEIGPALTFIGYSFDLTRQLVSIGEHTFKRATYAFYSTDTSVGHSVSTLQRLASYSSRMDEIVPVMRPFSASLHHSIRGHVWRAFLVIITFDPTTFTRSLLSFTRPPRPDFEFTFDASLSGIGSLLYSRSPQGELIQRGVIQIYPLPFDVTDNGSKNQNLMEFCAILVTILTLIAHGGHNLTILPTGDSIVALSWAKSTRVKGGDHTVSAALIFAIACMRFHIDIFDTTHIPGETNTIPDALSRNYTEVLEASPDPFIKDRRNYYDFTQFPSILSLLELCNPLLPLPSSDDEFIVLWGNILSLLDSLPTSQPHPSC